MGEIKKRNVHLPEFKAKVGPEAVRGVKAINQSVQGYGVHPVQVSQWKEEIQKQAKAAFRKMSSQLCDKGWAAAPLLMDVGRPESIAAAFCQVEKNTGAAMFWSTVRGSQKSPLPAPAQAHRGSGRSGRGSTCHAT